MAKNLVSLASGVVPEFSALETITAASEAGFDAVGIWVDMAEWSPATTTTVKQRLSATGLPVLDVEVVWIKAGPLDPDHLRIIDVGAEIGAANVLVVSSDPDQGATQAKFAALCEHGQQAGLRVSLEFGMFTEVRTISEALAIATAVANPAAGILVDPIHLDRSCGTPAQVATVPRHLLSYAQLCDAGMRTFDPADFDAVIRDAVDERLLLGEGVLPVADIVAALPPLIPFSIELRSKALRDAYPEAVERAKVVAQASRRFLAKL
ncbi:sugar phosphate isomerase/epimerase family protein [Novosphingobium malaysiense]|uniref:Xylose isomerase n=1 Tax=Novosphingobium malaysiense TaxID=1348853 RepID=A0A0B1ZT92_9SPHN|nr:TIM barrel protein [Novosphingobium malaysiense]KHK92664.1 xylose isomerase [Novosphingobium malaysiense]